ncbi:MAG: iron-containing alcohol dehydrogenase, partial [Oscillospiraceae bacterium]|nr:iron-containing alcohol dehydrogenase [Oscillospiraceae bacterium]
MPYRLLCRVFQLILKIAAYGLPLRKPLLIEGAGSLKKLPERITLKGAKSVLLITNEVITSLGLADTLLKDLKKAKINCVIYDKTVTNPTTDDIEEALIMYLKHNCEGIIAFGGTFSIDCAKGLGARIARPRKSIKQMRGFMKVLCAPPPLFVIPTAAGMGSETTASAIVVDSETKEKYKLTDPKLIPQEAVLDPLLTVKLPPHITAANGMDTLTHAIEGYIGHKNTPETRILAKNTVKLVFDNLHDAFTDRENITARLNMQRAAHFGGIVRTRTSGGNVGALANALSETYNTSHGKASAVILPHVLDDYGHTIYAPLSELADALNISGRDAEQKSRNFIAAIRKLCALVDIPQTLDEIKEADITTMATCAFNEANPGYPVPKIFAHRDFVSVYLRLMTQSEHFTLPGSAALIDLSKGEVSDFFLQKDDLNNFLGGKGLAAKIIHATLDKQVEALSEENLIVITTAPLNATSAPGSARFNISTISPLTGLLTSSNCGGDFGESLRHLGYAALIIRGIAPNKTYLKLDNEGIHLLDAEEIWGMSTSMAQEIMSPGATLAIGIAGENLVRYACVSAQSRIAGRGGIGAVFGFKQLKGIVAISKHTPTATSDEFKQLSNKWTQRLGAHPVTGDMLPNLGTAAFLTQMQHKELLATKNYRKSSFDKFEDISGETLSKKHTVKGGGCTSCPIGCQRIVRFENREVKGPELNTLCLLGANLENNDLSSIVHLNHLCDEYGIDTISFGGSVGFAIELNEKGLWENGLKSGNPKMLEALLAKVARREDIGDDLAEGVMRMSEKYGGREFALHVKGMELPAYDPRTAQGMGLGYATSNRGGCHIGGGYTVALEALYMDTYGTNTRGKAALTVFAQDILDAVSASGSCIFTASTLLPPGLINRPTSIFTRIWNALMPHAGGLLQLAHNHPIFLNISHSGALPHPYAVKLITGDNMNLGRFMRIGERIYNMERLINIRQGLKHDDTLPDRLKSPLQKSAGQRTVALNKMLKK